MLTKLNHDFISFSGKPQKSEAGMPEREILILFTFPNMSREELFDKKIVSEYNSNEKTNVLFTLNRTNLSSVLLLCVVRFNVN